MQRQWRTNSMCLSYRICPTALTETAWEESFYSADCDHWASKCNTSQSAVCPEGQTVTSHPDAGGGAWQAPRWHWGCWPHHLWSDQKLSVGSATHCRKEQTGRFTAFVNFTGCHSCSVVLSLIKSKHSCNSKSVTVFLQNHACEKRREYFYLWLIVCCPLV